MGGWSFTRMTWFEWLLSIFGFKPEVPDHEWPEYPELDKR